MIRILQGDCREVLATLPDASVQCVVTSPPYYGLRDYGVAGQIGLEASPDEFVATMVAVFREVRRVLRPDGTLWLNMGDSYAMSTKGSGAKTGSQGRNLGAHHTDRHWQIPTGLKAKDLMLMPARVALALQADGWWLRSAIVWHKPNPMPESVVDRPTSSYEMVYLFAKSERYYYDGYAIAEQSSSAYAEKTNQAVQDVRTDAAARSVLSEKRRSNGARLQAVLAAARDGMASDADRATEVSGRQCIFGGEREDGPLFRLPERKAGDYETARSAPRQESWSHLHSDKAGMGCDQVEGGLSLPLLQETAETASNGSCDPAQQRRTSRSVQHRASLQELQQQEGSQRSNVALRNARNVWTISTHAYPEAHFATYPPALVERCIKAGTSERGCCAQCGAPWVRQVEREPTRPGVTGGATPYDSNRPDGMTLRAGGFGGGSCATTGWTPSCRCNAGTAPCVVLDPFAGAGTTLLVADQLQRHAIGIELNPAYAAMIRNRIADDAGMFAEVAD